MELYRKIATDHQPLSKEDQHQIWIDKIKPLHDFLDRQVIHQLSLFATPKTTYGLITDNVIRSMTEGVSTKEKRLATIANEGINLLVNHNMQLILSVIARYSQIQGVDGEDYIIPCLVAARRAIQRYKFDCPDSAAKIGNWIRFWVDGACKSTAKEFLKPMGDYKLVSLDNDESHLQVAYPIKDTLLDECLDMMNPQEQSLVLGYYSCDDLLSEFNLMIPEQVDSILNKVRVSLLNI